jgi:hypothetical protein
MFLGDILMIKAVSTSKICQFLSHYTAQYTNIPTHCHEKLKSDLYKLFLDTSMKLTPLLTMNDHELEKVSEQYP